MDRAPTLGTLQILPKPAVGLVDAGLHLQVLHAARDLLGVHPLQQRHRIVVDEAPDLRVELAEDRPDVRLPGPPEVIRELSQFLKCAIEFGHPANIARSGFCCEIVSTLEKKRLPA